MSEPEKKETVDEVLARHDRELAGIRADLSEIKNTLASLEGAINRLKVRPT